jgi:hypothetical protein
MNVVKPSNNSNHFTQVIPREYVEAATLLIRDKGQNGDFEEQAVTCSETNGYLRFEFVYDFREEATYDFYLNDADGNLLYRGQFFATNNTDLQNYRAI